MLLNVKYETWDWISSLLRYLALYGAQEPLQENELRYPSNMGHWCQYHTSRQPSLCCGSQGLDTALVIRRLLDQIPERACDFTVDPASDCMLMWIKPFAKEINYLFINHGRCVTLTKTCSLWSRGRRGVIVFAQKLVVALSHKASCFLIALLHLQTRPFQLHRGLAPNAQMLVGWKVLEDTPRWESF